MSWYDPRTWGKKSAPIEPPPPLPTPTPSVGCRTYWELRADGAFVFLDAFQRGHQPGETQIGAAALDINDLDALGFFKKTGAGSRGPLLLVGVPEKIAKRMLSRIQVMSWAQLEGYVR